MIMIMILQQLVYHGNLQQCIMMILHQCIMMTLHQCIMMTLHQRIMMTLQQCIPAMTDLGG